MFAQASLVHRKQVANGEGEGCGLALGGDLGAALGERVSGLACRCVGACADPRIADAPSTCVPAEGEGAPARERGEPSRSPLRAKAPVESPATGVPPSPSPMYATPLPHSPSPPYQTAVPYTDAPAVPTPVPHTDWPWAGEDYDSLPATPHPHRTVPTRGGHGGGVADATIDPLFATPAPPPAPAAVAAWVESAQRTAAAAFPVNAAIAGVEALGQGRDVAVTSLRSGRDVTVL
eukprot:gene32134-62874_t